MVEAELTPEQQSFATENHGLVYAFLNERKLQEDDYYDIVVFGYLNAVREYLTNIIVRQKYEFSTIAYRKMNDTLYRHNEYSNRQKRKAFTISLDSIVFGDSEAIPFQEALSIPDSTALEFETELLMLELASRVSKREMAVIRMKTNGYGAKEIAKAQQIPIKGVNEMLAGLRETVLAVCYG
jgi:DNA-directed RNA polymerase specialized sigma24 family protein